MRQRLWFEAKQRARTAKREGEIGDGNGLWDAVQQFQRVQPGAPSRANAPPPPPPPKTMCLRLASNAALASSHSSPSGPVICSSCLPSLVGPRWSLARLGAPSSRPIKEADEGWPDATWTPAQRRSQKALAAAWTAQHCCPASSCTWHAGLDGVAGRMSRLDVCREAVQSVEMAARSMISHIPTHSYPPATTFRPPHAAVSGQSIHLQ